MLVNARLPPCAQCVSSFFMRKKKLNISFFEKDEKFGNLVREYIRVHDWNLTLFNDIREMINAIADTEQNILVFDIENNLDSIPEITKKVRDVSCNVFIIFIGEGDYSGQAIYLRKPFALQKLADVITKRSDNYQIIYQLGNIIFNSGTGTVIVNGKEKKISSKENKLLLLLCNNMNDIVERSVALETIWNKNDHFNTRSMDVYLSKLRHLLSEEPKVRIENILKKGFILYVEK